MASPIDVFFTTAARGGNDAANKARELTLASIATEPAQPANSRHTLVREGWIAALKSLCADADRFVVRQTAGRNYNYDFEVVYFCNSDVVATVKVEFKHNAREITGIPQFLSLGSNALPFAVSYAAFYYDNYLRRYIATDAGITAAVPERAAYLAQIHSDNYDRQPLFRQMYEREETAKRAKATVVNESIAEYLRLYGNTIDRAALSEALWRRQEGKKFLLWDRERFHVQEFTKEELTIVEVGEVRRNNTLIARSSTRTFALLLRWKNHKGILYPAWQIKMLS